MIFKKLLDKKYFPLYLFSLGLIVFAGAFFYASRKGQNEPLKAEEESTSLTNLDTQSEVLTVETENLAEVSLTPTIKQPAKKLTPTVVPTNSPTLTPTTTPTTTPSPQSENNTATPSPMSVVSPSLTPTIGSSPTPVVTTP